MGFWSTLFGSKKKGYQPQHTKDYDNQLYNSLQNRQNNPLTGQAGVDKATSGFDYSPVNQAIQGYQNPAQFKETYQSGYAPKAYNPYQFNFGSLPSQYGQQSYDLGAGNIQRQGAGDLQSLSEKVGTRRPGLLAKLGQQGQRNTEEQLGNLGGQIGLETMRQNIELGKQQQQAQAGENMGAARFGEGQAQFGAGEGYKGYESRANLEGKNADERFRNLGGLYSSGMGKIQSQEGQLQNERNYEDQGTQMLANAFGQSMQGSDQAAQIANQNKGILGSLGALIAPTGGGLLNAFGGGTGAAGAAGGGAGAAGAALALAMKRGRNANTNPMARYR